MFVVRLITKSEDSKATTCQKKKRKKERERKKERKKEGRKEGKKEKRKECKDTKARKLMSCKGNEEI